MADIQMRFHKDMLVLSAPLDTLLARQGVNASLDRQYLNLMEPDCVYDALALEMVAGAHCAVTTTEDITQARLSHVRMDGDASRLAKSALDIANSVKPQHVLVEIGPCGLPLDSSSKASLNENRAQYANAARLFEGGAFDAFFLNGFSSISDMRCALMGVSQVTTKPVFASMGLGTEESPDWPAAMAKRPTTDVDPEEIAEALPFGGYELLDDPQAPPAPAARRSKLHPDLWPEALDLMTDLGASVVGFETTDPIQSAVEYARVAIERTDVPVLAQLCVTEAEGRNSARNLKPLADIDEYTPDTMAVAAVKLFGAGVQFLRATGMATPAFTGSLCSTVAGLDVRKPG